MYNVSQMRTSWIAEFKTVYFVTAHFYIFYKSLFIFIKIYLLNKATFNFCNAFFSILEM